MSLFLELELASGWNISLLGEYATMASTTLYIYDCLLTFSHEYSRIWSAKITGASILYFLNRYGFLLYSILYALADAPGVGDTYCKSLSITHWICLIIVFSSSILIFTLRTYAITGKSRAIFFLLAIIGFAKVAVIIYISVFDVQLPYIPKMYQFGPYVCDQLGSVANSSSLHLADYVLTLTFDTLVFSITFLKTFRLAKQARRVHIKNSLTYLILRDGTAYYLPVMLLSIFQIAIELISWNPSLSNAILVTNISGPFNQTLTAIIVNRLVLNLRAVASTSAENSLNVETISFSSRELSNIRFDATSSAVIGNLGEPLRDESESLSAEPSTGESLVGDRDEGSSGRKGKGGELDA